MAQGQVGVKDSGTFICKQSSIIEDGTAQPAPLFAVGLNNAREVNINYCTIDTIRNYRNQGIGIAYIGNSIIGAVINNAAPLYLQSNGYNVIGSYYGFSLATGITSINFIDYLCIKLLF